MEFDRSITCVEDVARELGTMKPSASRVSGEETSVPLMHCRQLINWVTADILIYDLPGGGTPRS